MNHTLVGNYSASGGNLLPIFRDKPDPEDETDGLSRNVSSKLPLLAA
jgi:hypothetical protein